MGHWDQIGQENAERRERLAAMPQRRRRLVVLIDDLKALALVAPMLSLGYLFHIASRG